MKQKKIKEFINFLFPEDSIKVISIVVIIIIIVFSIITTFVIVKFSKKNVIQEKTTTNSITQVEEFELIEPEYQINEKMDFNFANDKIEKPQIEDFEELLKYHEFGDFTDYFLNLQFYEKKVNEFLKN